MAKKGLHFIYYIYPKDGENFTLIKRYRFITGFSHNKYIIDLEYHENCIVIIKFFVKGFGSDNEKYEVRVNAGAGEIISVLKQCFKLFDDHEKRHALIFNAANDVNKIMELNSRFTTYENFIQHYYRKNLKDYSQSSAIKINSFLFYHKSYEYQDEVKAFFKGFEEKIKEDLVIRAERIAKLKNGK